ncbi:hypothetical protein [Actinokineospora sp. UTMC 2448]|uniref:hypothetical protein n=1 Tax=Actinokineospora sp. UTMC 2448 TaxID=2268449 RepID=UPI002164B567|nr:hypothetical protein [Actinokineospora sp. UTMC 2448]UVS82575.1 hypothetical protein Actkin_06348 [Actinokineospora sp. UTMC 2448]
MIRRVAAGLAVLLAAAGCSDEPEPVPVAEDFSDTVTSLLRAVDGGATPSFGAETCGAWPATPDQVITWADAALTGVAPERLRAAAVAAGWQPQTADGVDLALVGPHDVLLALTGGTVRAERPNCTKSGDSRRLDHNDFTRPDPTEAQARAVADGQERAARTAAAIRGIIELGGRAADEPALANCGGAGPRGVTWTMRDTAKLPARTNLPAVMSQMDEELRSAGWTTQSTPDGMTATGDGLTATITARHSSIEGDPSPFLLEIRPGECVPVTGS